jgi:hypothetical protein
MEPAKKEQLNSLNKTLMLYKIKNQITTKGAGYLLKTTAALRTAGLKTRVSIMCKGSPPAGAALTSMSDQQLDQDTATATDLIMERLPEELAREVINQPVHAMWISVTEWDDNDELEVIHSKEDAYDECKPAQFKAIKEYTTSKRTYYLRLKEAAPDRKTEEQFLEDIIKDCRGTELKEEIKQCYRLLKGDDGLSYRQLQKRLIAAEKTERFAASEVNQGKGGVKVDEDFNNTALMARMHGTLDRQEAQLKKLQSKRDVAMFASNSNTKKGNNGGNNVDRQKATCFNFDGDGVCTFGAHCRFMHDGRQPRDSDRPKDQHAKEQRGGGRANKHGRKRKKQINESSDSEDEANVVTKRGKHRNQFGLIANESMETENVGANTKRWAQNVSRNVNYVPLLIIVVLSMLVLASTTAVNRLMHRTAPGDYTTQHIDLNVNTVLTTGLVISGGSYFSNLSLIDWSVETSSESDEVAMFADNDDAAVSDTGASCLVLGTPDTISRMYDCVDCNKTIYMNNNPEKITKTGKFDVYLPVDGTSTQRKIVMENVNAVPTSNHNLFPVSRFLDAYTKATGKEGSVVYYRTNGVLTLPGGGTYTFKRVGNLYYMRLGDLACEEMSYLAANASMPADETINTEKPAKLSKRQIRRRRKNLPRLVESSASEDSDDDCDNEDGDDSHF